MFASDLAISIFFLGDQGSGLVGSQRLFNLAFLCQFLLLHDGCGDGGGCEDSVVEYC